MVYLGNRKHTSLIRLATQDDYIDILRLCLEFYKSSPYKDLPESIEMIDEEIRKYLHSEPSQNVILLLVDSLGHPRGILAGGMSSIPFSPMKVAYEGVWFVEEAYRGKEAIQLLYIFEYWANKHGADVINMNLLNNEFKDPLTKLYLRKGYVEAETSFIKRLR